MDDLLDNMGSVPILQILEGIMCQIEVEQQRAITLHEADFLSSRAQHRFTELFGSVGYCSTLADLVRTCCTVPVRCMDWLLAGS